MKENYSAVLEKTLETVRVSGKKPTLLLHACCAPCSSYVLEYLSPYFNIALFYFNPNISPESEFDYRLRELERLVREAGYDIPVIAPQYDSSEFFSSVRGLENLPEGGERCRICYRLRLTKTAEYAAESGADYFCTTLSISPYKNAEWLNKIGLELGEKYGMKYLVSDFKKKNGYKRSIELSGQYGLYRQRWCGCVYSRAAREKYERESGTI